MQFIHSILLGLLSAIAGFFPISTTAHQYLYGYLTGFSQISPFLLLMIYFGMLAAVIVCYRHRLVHIRRELRLASLPKKRRKRMPDMLAVSDFRLVLTAMIPIIIGLVFESKSQQTFRTLPWLCVTTSVTGILLYALQFLSGGNRDSRQMNRPEGLMLGVLCAVSVIPGLSHIALFSYFTRKRGCSREYSLDLVFLVSIPMLVGMMILQMIALISAGTAGLTGDAIAAGVLASAVAFGGGLAAIRLMRYLAVKLDFQGFSYYCWGFSVFCFIYYLMT